MITLKKGEYPRSVSGRIFADNCGYEDGKFITLPTIAAWTDYGLYYLVSTRAFTYRLWKHDQDMGRT